MSHEVKGQEIMSRPLTDATEVTKNGFSTGTRRPRLLYIITRAERGGAQAHVLELAQSMRQDFEVHVATGEEGFLTVACRDSGIPVHVIRHLQRQPNPLADLPAWFEVASLMRRIRPDLVHAHTWKSGFIGRSAALACGIPSIYTVHMWPFGPAVPRVWSLVGPHVERIAAKWSRRLIVVSESGAEIGRRYGIAPPSRIVAIENGIADCPHRASLTGNAVPVIAMVARFTSFKDHETLLRAFAASDSPARLLLVGDGPTRGAVERLIVELGIGARVELAGDRGDVPQLLADIDVFVLASKLELFPISILEAMRAGLPVIASNVGGIPQLVVDGSTGLLVAPGSVPAMTEAICRMVRDCNLRLRLGRAGRLRYEQRFDSRLMCARTRSVYCEVLAEDARLSAMKAQLARQE